MILLDIAKEMKTSKGYEEIPTNDLVEALRDGFGAIADLAEKEGIEFALQIPKFGTFKVEKRQARTGFNPQTKEKIAIPEKTVIKFRASSLMKDRLMAIAVSSPKKKKKKSKKKR
jgi:nucleoid DNA-binding protein